MKQVPVSLAVALCVFLIAPLESQPAFATQISNANYATVAGFLGRLGPSILIPSAVPQGFPTIACASAAAGKVYAIVFGFIHDCEREAACAATEVDASHGVSPLKGKIITLRGTVAHYTSMPCTASCARSFLLALARSGLEHRTSLKADNLPEALVIANSMRPRRALNR